MAGVPPDIVRQQLVKYFQLIIIWISNICVTDAQCIVGTPATKIVMKLVLAGVGRNLRNVRGGEETISNSNQTFSPKNQLILQILFSPRMAFDS